MIGCASVSPASRRISVTSIPAPVRQALRPLIGPVARRTPGRIVRWGTLRRLRPFSGHYGRDRGESIDRRYIAAFMAANADRVRGDVLEVREPLYASRAGSAVTRVEVIDIDDANRQATLIADLTAAGSLPASSYDCAVVTQTLQFLWDVEACVANLRQALRPGGTLLLTVPCLSKVDHEAPASDYWRWTPAGLKLLLERSFPGDMVRVEGYGNVLTSVAFLMGLAQEDLREQELDFKDPRHPLVACARVDRAS
jgi:SAM-dependent methyltransferase